MIHLEEVNEANWRLGLEVAADQKHFVSSSDRILARAYAYRNAGSRAFVIYHGDIPVGMAMYHDCDPMNCYDLSQLFIDKRYQGKGYGRAATELILDMMRQERKYADVALCYIEGNEAARKLYESFGFRITGQDEDEIIMELTL